MSQYNEPWNAEERRNEFRMDDYNTIVDSLGNELIGATSYEGIGLPDFSDEIRDRIVACVNACQGFTNEQLAAGVIQKARPVRYVSSHAQEAIEKGGNWGGPFLMPLEKGCAHAFEGPLGGKLQCVHCGGIEGTREVGE